MRLVTLIFVSEESSSELQEINKNKTMMSRGFRFFMSFFLKLISIG
jgi:hypothetical protein